MGVSTVEEKIVASDRIDIGAADIEHFETWTVYLVKQGSEWVSYLMSMLMNDFWQMLDLTHAIDEAEAAIESVELRLMKLCTGLTAFSMFSRIHCSMRC